MGGVEANVEQGCKAAWKIASKVAKAGLFEDAGPAPERWS